MQRLPVDQFPNVTFPFVAVTTIYPGAGPSEMETLVSKPIEDELSTVSGVKAVNSVSLEGYSQVFVEFTLETDVKYAEQQVRDRVSVAKAKLPKEIDEPVVRRFDPQSDPIVVLALESSLSDEQIFDLADEVIRPRLEQVRDVGSVEILGGRKREIHVLMDRAKLKEYELSALQVSQQLGLAGENIPLGKTDTAKRETIYRAMGQFTSIDKIKSIIVKFLGNDIPIKLKDIAQVVDAKQDETNRAYLNGRKSLFINVFKQSGSNTVAVADGVKKRMAVLNEELALRGGAKLSLVRDGAKPIRDNLSDVRESIILGVILAVIVVFFFLGNLRSTVITGLALPNSLIGAFILIALAGFSVNTMSLMALSLAVGLLIDDAIVVRENIFRHLEMGKTPRQAAEEGTEEVRLAVIATTLAVVAVFGSIAFVKGITGQFIREFGVTVCFAMCISLFDALTVAPMLSAHFAGAHGAAKRPSYERIWSKYVQPALDAFGRFQDRLEVLYERLLRVSLKVPGRVLLISFAIFVVTVSTVIFLPKDFMPNADNGEIIVDIDLPPGASLDAMNAAATVVDSRIRANREVQLTSLTVGSWTGAANEAEIFVQLVPSRKRKLNTTRFKEVLRSQLKEFAYANPRVRDFDPLTGGMRPFTLNLMGTDLKELEEMALKVVEHVKKNPRLKDADLNFKPGKPELQVVLDDYAAPRLGVTSRLVGGELRAQIEGEKAAKYRENGREYDVRIRLQENQRKLEDHFDQMVVPNVNYRLISLPKVAKAVPAEGPSTINRRDRTRYVQITADLAPGAGLGDAMEDMRRLFATELKLKPGMWYQFAGLGDEFDQMTHGMTLAALLAILFIYLVLASLYESFVTPLAIMLALPLAVCGAFVALWVGRESLNLLSIIACIMLLGIATKNSILLVDYTNQLVAGGMNLIDALIKAGKTRLRPILMTSMALIAGTLPLAIGLNEASKQRTSMGYVIIGGVVSSTLLTLVVVPAMLALVRRWRDRKVTPVH